MLLNCFGERLARLRLCLRGVPAARASAAYVCLCTAVSLVVPVVQGDVVAVAVPCGGYGGCRCCRRLACSSTLVFCVSNNQRGGALVLIAAPFCKGQDHQTSTSMERSRLPTSASHALLVTPRAKICTRPRPKQIKYDPFIIPENLFFDINKCKMSMPRGPPSFLLVRHGPHLGPSKRHSSLSYKNSRKDGMVLPFLAAAGYSPIAL